MAKKPSHPRQDDRLFLNSILDNIPNMIFVKDAKTLRFVRFNKAGEKLLGMTSKELLGKNDYDFFPKEEADFFTQKDHSVLRSQRLLDIPEETIHTRKKGVRILHTKKIPLLDASGKPRYLLGISEDITERRNAEKALHKTYTQMEARTQELNTAVSELESFSYSVSHDLRAPLRAIEGFSKILLEEHGASLNPDAQRLLQVVRKNALQMAQLIDDLLTFSRIARKDFVKHRVPMEDLAKVIVEDLRQSPQGERCHMIVNRLPDIQGDAPLLRQVWINLLANAVKFTRPVESPRIEIGAEDGTDFATYSIKDNGVGFEMEYVNKLFGVFQRLHNAQEFEGTGVGLAIVQRIILKHGGRVWAEGKPGQGASFYFSLPKTEEKK